MVKRRTSWRTGGRAKNDITACKKYAYPKDFVHPLAGWHGDVFWRMFVAAGKYGGSVFR